MQATHPAIADLNRAIVYINQLLELPEPQRTRLIERTLAMGDGDLVEVLRLYLSRLSAGLRDVPDALPGIEHVRTFLLSACTIEYGAVGVRANDLYSAYATWCERQSLRPLSQTSFGRAAGSLTPKRAMNRGIVYTMLSLLP